LLRFWVERSLIVISGYFTVSLSLSQAGECFEGVDAGEGSERGGEFRREVNGGDGAVEEGEGVEGGEGLKGSW